MLSASYDGPEEITVQLTREGTTRRTLFTIPGQAGGGGDATPQSPPSPHCQGHTSTCTTHARQTPTALPQSPSSRSARRSAPGGGLGDHARSARQHLAAVLGNILAYRGWYRHDSRIPKKRIRNSHSPSPARHLHDVTVIRRAGERFYQLRPEQHVLHEHSRNGSSRRARAADISHSVRDRAQAPRVRQGHQLPDFPAVERRREIQRGFTGLPNGQLHTLTGLQVVA